MFMGTPHVGSNLARWTKVLTGISNIVRKSNTEIIGVLKPGSEMLANLQQEFHTMLEKRSKDGKPQIKIFCFYEEIPVVGVGEASLAILYRTMLRMLSCPSIKIVPKHSAILSAYRCQSIHANHMDMTRFSGANDPGYQAVSGELWLWANEIEEQLASKPLQAQPTKECVVTK
jgi:protein SERAC1